MGAGQKAKVAALAVAVLVASVGLRVAGPPGALNVGGGVIVGLTRPADGRASGFGMFVQNESATDALQLVSIDLIGGHGLALAGAYTFGGGVRFCGGCWVPPLPADSDGEAPADGLDLVANWEARVPLSQTVLAPGEYRDLVLGLQPTSAEDCQYAEGYVVRYRQRGRLFAVYSDGAAIVYYYDPASDIPRCPDASAAVSAARDGWRWWVRLHLGW